MRRTLLLLPLLAVACATPESAIHAARLSGRVTPELSRLCTDFRVANPGYDLAWLPGVREVTAAEQPRVAFVQEGRASAVLHSSGRAIDAGEPALASGDVALLRPGERLTLDAPLGLLVFTLPGQLPPELPGFVRPDHDPRITDTPGGCAEEDDAYRRILLTWLEEVGPYQLHTLNAHRVRINDSFSHYHPVEGGFDELYLVQEAPAGARLLTSESTERILDPASVARSEASNLLQARELAVGDLVYLPRGTVHRGLGGAVVQVITVPGFRPGAEVGVDHHLKAINELLGLEDDEVLPYRAGSADEAVIR